MNLTKIKTETPDKRVESGPLQIDNDWPGVFFRGDSSHYLGFQLESFFKMIENKEFELAREFLTHPLMGGNIRTLPKDLMSCHIDNFKK